MSRHLLGTVDVTVEIVVRYDGPTFGRTLVLADPATLEAALDAVALGADAAELERLTEAAPGALGAVGWRVLAPVAAQFTGARDGDLTRAFRGALALAPVDDDHDTGAGRRGS